MWCLAEENNNNDSFLPLTLVTCNLQYVAGAHPKLKKARAGIYMERLVFLTCAQECKVIVRFCSA